MSIPLQVKLSLKYVLLTTVFLIQFLGIQLTKISFFSVHSRKRIKRNLWHY